MPKLTKSDYKAKKGPINKVKLSTGDEIEVCHPGIRSIMRIYTDAGVTKEDWENVKVEFDETGDPIPQKLPPDVTQKLEDNLPLLEMELACSITKDPKIAPSMDESGDDDEQFTWGDLLPIDRDVLYLALFRPEIGVMGNSFRPSKPDDDHDDTDIHEVRDTPVSGSR